MYLFFYSIYLPVTGIGWLFSTIERLQQQHRNKEAKESFWSVDWVFDEFSAFVSLNRDYFEGISLKSSGIIAGKFTVHK